MSALLPCPLCAAPAEEYRATDTAYRVVCSECELETANYPTQEAADEHWNQRPQLSNDDLQKRAPTLLQLGREDTPVSAGSGNF